VRFLFRIGVTVEGSLVRAGSNIPASTILPSDEFNDQVNAVSAWREEIEYQRLENRLGQVAEDLGGVSRNEALSAVLAFYEANGPDQNRVSGVD
jgi:hypothetical protein